VYISNSKIDPLIKSLTDLGFSNSQITKLITKIKKISDRLDTFDESYAFYHKNMISLGYSEYQIKELACEYPRAVYHRFCGKKILAKHKEYIDSIPMNEKSKPKKSNNFKFDKIALLLSLLGVSEERIKRIFSVKSKIIYMTTKELWSNINFYLKCGLDDETIVKILDRHATFLEQGESYYLDSIKKAEEYGLNLKDFGKIIKNISLSYHRILNNTDLIELLEWADKKTIIKEKFGKSVTKTSSIIIYPKNLLDNAYENIMKLGFTKEETGKIVSYVSSILVMSFDNLKDKFQRPLTYGCSEENVRSIILGYPEFLTLSPDTIERKFSVYKNKKLTKYIVEKPKNIMQNAELTEKRADYLNKFHDYLDEIKYAKKVFATKQDFEREFGYSNNGNIINEIGGDFMSKNNDNGLVDLLNNCGFSETQIRRLIFTFNRFKNRFENNEDFELYYRNYEATMIKLGYEDYEIHELAATHPKVMFQSFIDGNLEEYYQKYISTIIKKKPKLSIERKIEGNRRILLDLGLEKEKVNELLKIDLPITEMHPRDLMDNILFYLGCTLTDEDLIKIINSNSKVLLFGAKEYQIILDEFDCITKKILGEIIRSYNKWNTTLQPDVLYKILKFASSKELDMKKFIKGLKNTPLKNLSEEELNEEFAGLLEIGFTEKQAKESITNSMSILYNTKSKVEYIIEVGKRYAIAKEDIISILTGFPSLTACAPVTIVEKIYAIARYNLTSYVVNHPKSLIQGAELIWARAWYLRLFHPKVTSKEFACDIFSQESSFVKKYNRENTYLKELRNLMNK